jgi:CDP-6-deoxy-D-xylo-4-hexulose-3-dehydrase
MNWLLMKDTITFADRFKMAKFALSTKKFTNGEQVVKFENQWSNWLGCKHSLFVSSGSTANFLLVAAIKEKYKLNNGDKVLVPACTWVTNIAPVIQLGLTPIFCDINLQNFSFDISEAKYISTIHPDIKLIFISHLLGFAGDNEKLKEIFPNAIIIDDVCESHGARFSDGSKVGSDSLGATFSFYFGHHMSTIEGGMVCTNDSDLYDLMRMKRSHGMARESNFFEEYAKQNPSIEKSFLFITDGYNFRNHEICAVLGQSQLRRLDDMINIRRKNYNNYVDLLDYHYNLFHSHNYDEGNSSFCFPFVCKTIKIKENLRQLFVENNIEFRPIVSGNLLKHPFLKNYNITSSKEVLNVDLIHENGIYIGNNHFITTRNIQNLLEIISLLKVK